MSNFSKNQIIYNTGVDIENLYLITSGSVTAYSLYGQYKLGPGSIIGLADGYYGISLFTYVVDDDVSTDDFSFSSVNDYANIIKKYSNGSKFVQIANSFLLELVKTYLSLNVKCRKRDADYAIDSRIDRWELDKINAISTMNPSTFIAYYSHHAAVATAGLIETARFASMLNDANLQMGDFLGINYEYVEPEEEPEEVYIPSDSLILDDTAGSILAELRGSFNKILKYSGSSKEFCEEFTALIDKLKSHPNKLASDDDTRQLRRSIASSFYILYKNTFFRSVTDDAIPLYIKMFLNFGYIDEELVSANSAITLYQIVQDIEYSCNNSRVHTMYNWLKMIMRGEKEPSKNHLEQTFEDYVKEMARMGKLDDRKALTDTYLKVEYEIENMFKQTHRMTYGKVSAFLPILIEENVMKPLETVLNSCEAIMNSINMARNIDFSLFYRSTVYSNIEIGIGKEFIYTEVLPDVILTPCIGTYGAMWQEIENRNRNTPGRFVLPIFCNVKPENLILNILGKFRWELCKRIQGAYWNNITEKSLTSEYCDYLQFYKKNHDLTDQVKEKIKSTLTNCRNNYAEVFARDYEQWILYESSGSARLNKVSRVIMAKYCPFTKDRRQALSQNPTYTKAFEIYEKNCANQKRRIDTIFKVLENKDIPVPREIRETKAYLNK